MLLNHATTLLAAGAVTALTCPAYAIDDQGAKSLGNLSIEDLMKVEVTTAGKQAQAYQNVPAAIYVVTAEAIRRSGATNIPEAIRLVPGVQVAQISPEQYQVSIRGFSSEYNNKLLVMIDGRSVYNTTFSGVYWDNQAIAMDDIDRIEVIRGPGGSLWGTNAVNGIINVITKKSSDTQGGYASLSTSTLSPYELDARYGGRLGNAGTYRFFGKAFSQSNLMTLNGQDSHDDWRDLRGGFRADWASGQDALMFTGSLNSEHLGHAWGTNIVTPPYTGLATPRFPTSDADLLANWKRTSGVAKGAEVQLYFAHNKRNDPGLLEDHEIFSADAKLPLDLTPTNRLTVGVGYHSTRDNFVSGFYVQLPPGQIEEDLLSAYVHDEWRPRPNLTFAIGGKVERNRFTGWEFQPSASATWNPSPKSTIWAASSRAVRTPSVADELSNIVTNVTANQGTVYITDILGSKDFSSEVEFANEVGWRYAPSDTFLIDCTAFYNQYSELRSFTSLPPYQNAAGTVLPAEFSNNLSAVTAGFELAGKVRVARDWQLEPSYTLYSAHYYFPSGPVDFDGLTAAERSGSAPRNQFGLRSLVNLPYRFEFDTSMSYTDHIAVNNVAAFARVDARVGWRPTSLTEFSVGCQNLFAAHHVEALTVFTVADSIPRNFYAKFTVRF